MVLRGLHIAGFAWVCLLLSCVYATRLSDINPGVAPNFLTWRCTGRSTNSDPASTTLHVNSTEVQLDVCDVPSVAGAIDDANEPGKFNEQEVLARALWAKFLAVKRHWNMSVSEIVSDWNLLKGTIPGGDSIEGITAWVNSLSQNKVLLKKGYVTSKLLERMGWGMYAAKKWTGKHVLIVGAGPVGLRMAIEARFMGADVVVADKRTHFTRANVMKMWPLAKSDLKSIGISELAVMKGAGSPQVNIALMQHALLRIALMLGVQVMTGSDFQGLRAEPGQRWQAAFGARRSDAIMELVDFDAVMDATGTPAAVAGSTLCGNAIFDQVIQPSQGGAAKIAITANWQRFDGDNDKKWAFGQKEILAVGAKMWQDIQLVRETLNGEPRVKIEDLVYLQSVLSNYVVMAAEVDEMKKHNIFKNPDEKNVDHLVARRNINAVNLEKVVREVSEDWQIPHDIHAGMLNGINKMSVFDFLALRFSAAPSTNDVAMLRLLPIATCHQDTKATTKNTTTVTNKISDSQRPQPGESRPPQEQQPQTSRSSPSPSSPQGTETTMTSSKVRWMNDWPKRVTAQFRKRLQKWKNKMKKQNSGQQPVDTNPESSWLDITGGTAEQKTMTGNNHARFSTLVKSEDDFPVATPSTVGEATQGVASVIVAASEEDHGQISSLEIGAHDSDPQIVLVIGDALWAPFWPEGTGMSRGILSVAHASFALTAFWSADDAEHRAVAIDLGSKWATVGTRATAGDCKGGNSCTQQKLKEYMEHGYGGKEPPRFFADVM